MRNSVIIKKTNRYETGFFSLHTSSFQEKQPFPIYKHPHLGIHMCPSTISLTKDTYDTTVADEVFTAMQFTRFDEVIAYMESFTNLEKQTDHYTTRVYRLDRMHALLDHIGHPERSYKKIHLAGSKGKGSTATFIASGLTGLGYKTGLYLSPHLSDYRERFTLSGTFFSDQLLVQTGNTLKDLLQDFHFSDQWGETNPTTFELYTAYAFLLFSLAGCQWAVIETGLGGRLDATNTIIPEASVLCPIELEHTKILGNTIAEIAGEKSKIIKQGVPCFIGFEEKAALEVFLQEAKAQASPVYLLEEELEAYQDATTADGEQVSFQWKEGRVEHLLLSMMGKVQAQNCALALLVLRKLGLYDQQTNRFLEKTTLPGRFQKISDNPNLYLDGAHTAHSLKALLESFSSLHPTQNNTIIYGALEDKDHTHMEELVLQYFHTIIISQPGTYKKSDIASIDSTLRSLAENKEGHFAIHLIEDNSKALQKAWEITPPSSAILVCGSFYLAGGVKSAYDTLRRNNVVKLA
ncbi:MAG: folylpolyglutamate synthase/dihydrofolate synthase family protein [Sphaerochaeta sp.]